MLPQQPEEALSGGGLPGRGGSALLCLKAGGYPRVFRMEANSDRGGSLLVVCAYPLQP